MQNEVQKNNILSTYTVLDVETPNKSNDSICSIAIAHVNDNIITDEKNFLVNPEDNFNEQNINIHNITKSMVQTESTFPVIWETIKHYFTNGIIVGHNVIFDLQVISKTLSNYNIPIPTFYYICTMNLSKRYYKIEKYSLDYLCSYFNIRLIQHHNAKSDVDSCNELFKKIISDNKITENDIKSYYLEEPYIKTATNTTIEKAINGFYGVIKGITSDKMLNELEISNIKKWMNENKKYSGSYPFNNIIKSIMMILEDNIITAPEKMELLKISNKYTSSKLYSEATLSMQVLMGIVDGISCDKKINELELNELKVWMNENSLLKGNYPFDIIYSTIEEVLEDEKLSIEENDMLISLFNKFINPVEESNEGTIECNNKSFCLTGNFLHGTKEDVSKNITSHGGNTVSGVTSKTDYLIVGGEGSSDWSYGNYGTKVKKAMELQSKGSPIKIISETDFYNIV